MRTFAERVRAIVRGISKGRTMTYRDVAMHAGNPQAARAVGAIMRTNHDPSIPCHRVVRSDGTPGGYTPPKGGRGGEARKRTLLRTEGALKGVI